MSNDLREFPGDIGPVLIRRDKVSAVKTGNPEYAPITVGVLVEGVWFWVGGDYESVRDWVRGEGSISAQGDRP